MRILDDYRESAEERDNKRIEISNISSEDIYDILNNHKDDFCRFVFCKMTKYENVKIEEEYPAEEDNSDNNNNNEVILGYSKGFILMYLVEYYLLKNRPQALMSYIKSMRIPNAMKYEKELKGIYDENL